MALTVASDEIRLAELAAERVTQLIIQAVAERGTAWVSLAGGTTPRRLYANLADGRQQWRDRIPWRQVHLFWSDERHVPPDHPDSNYGMAKAALLDRVPVPAQHVHRIRGELPDAREAATAYEQELERVASATTPSGSGMRTPGRKPLWTAKGGSPSTRPLGMAVRINSGTISPAGSGSGNRYKTA